MPVLLDLFCGAGGAARGYQQAGFYVVGVDIMAQPNYCGDKFIHADALEVLTWDVAEFADCIHASPVCMTFARATAWRGTRAAHPDMLAPVMELLAGVSVPWVVENIPDAPLRPDYVLCGSQFGLRVRRHRVFQTSWGSGQLTTPCDHRDLLPFMHKGERAYADAMGCMWMTNAEGRQAVPPAYTRYMGGQMLERALLSLPAPR